MDCATLQAFLEEHFSPPPHERAALAEGRWAAYLPERYPQPPWWAPGKRKSWKEALRRAVELPLNPRTDEVLFFGLWMGDNDSDGEDDHWVEATAMVFPDGAELIEAPLPRAEILRARSRPKPEEAVPAYSWRGQLAFEETGVEQALLSQVQAALEALQDDHDW